MSEQAPEIATARIDRALARIEAATTAVLRDQADLTARHAALRTQIADAITQIDSLIAAEEEED